MRHSARTSFLVAVASLAAAVSVHAQSAADVVEQMLDAYERNAEGVENYTLVQDAMGFESVVYFEKVTVEGRPVFRVKQSSAAGVTTGGDEDEGGYSEFYTLGPELAELATYDGRERIGEYEVHVLRLDDVSGLDFGGSAGATSGFTAKSGALYVDVDLLAPRRIVLDGELSTADGAKPVKSVIDLEDYREVEGFLVPHRTVVRTEGLAGAMDPDMRAQYEEMMRQLEEMSPEERAVLEQMMQGQLEQVEAMMAGGGDAVTVEVNVREVRINSGPPGA
jgi:hypothetical protein